MKAKNPGRDSFQDFCTEMDTVFLRCRSPAWPRFPRDVQDLQNESEMGFGLCPPEIPL